MEKQVVPQFVRLFFSVSYYISLELKQNKSKILLWATTSHNFYAFAFTNTWKILNKLLLLNVKES